MSSRVRVLVLGIVTLAHAALLYLLAEAMRPPPPSATVDERVLIVEFFQPPDPEPEPEPVEPEVEADPPPDLPAPTPRPPSRSAPMQATIVTSPQIEPEPARDWVAPDRDPFSRPQTTTPDAGFGRRDRAVLPGRQRPQVAGEAPPNAPLQGLRVHTPWDTRRIVETVGSLIGGGPDAPIEAPCGGRIASVNEQMTQAFSPHWNRDHGCGLDREPDRYDGRVELPPGTAR